MFDTIHLAFMTPKYLKLVVEGKKTVESRFYQKLNGHPALSCKQGHYISFKRTGGGIEARAVAGKVHLFQDLTPEKMQDIKAEFNDRILADDPFWENKKNSRAGILIELEQVVSIQIDKAELPTSREGWLILESPESLAKIPRVIDITLPWR